MASRRPLITAGPATGKASYVVCNNTTTGHVVVLLHCNSSLGVRWNSLCLARSNWPELQLLQRDQNPIVPWNGYNTLWLLSPDRKPHKFTHPPPLQTHSIRWRIVSQQSRRVDSKYVRAAESSRVSRSFRKHPLKWDPKISREFESFASLDAICIIMTYKDTYTNCFFTYVKKSRPRLQLT